MTTAQCYDQYRDLLTTLGDDTVPLMLLDEAARRCGWWETHRLWQRTYGRFHLGKEPVLTLIYETADASHDDVKQELCVMELLSTFPPTFDPNQVVIRSGGMGWFLLSRFQYDPGLPALRSLLTLQGKAQILRYRPGKRCTIRFDGLTRTSLGRAIPAQCCFAKQFADDRGAAIHVESLALWDASQRGELEFAVAQPIQWDESTRTLWQGRVPGQPIVKRLLSAEGPILAAQMGRAAASLPCSSLWPQQQNDAKKQCRRSAKYAQRLGAFFPELRPALDLLLERLVAIHATLDEQALRPIHGAPHPHQWLDDDGRLGLVDFDGFALGDPELDVATFITEMEFEDWTEVPVAAINAAFVAGYETVYGPLNPQLLNVYRAHKRLSKALRNAYAIRGDNDLRVEQALGLALVCVC